MLDDLLDVVGGVLPARVWLGLIGVGVLATGFLMEGWLPRTVCGTLGVLIILLSIFAGRDG